MPDDPSPVEQLQPPKAARQEPEFLSVPERLERPELGQSIEIFSVRSSQRGFFGSSAEPSAQRFSSQA